MEVLDPKYFDREISWVRFNERVLEEAVDPRNPLLERLNYLQIFSSNLDEFYMKRVGGIKRQLLAKVAESGMAGTSPQQALQEIRKAVLPLIEKFGSTCQNDILPEMEKAGIEIVPWQKLKKQEKEILNTFFVENIFPILTPLAVDPGHPFPFISNLSVSFGILLQAPGTTAEELFARVKVPPIFPAWLRLSSEESQGKIRFASLYELIGNNLHTLFPGMELLDIMMFRVTRNADIERDSEDAEDLLAMVAEELKERRFARVVRLEHGPKKNQKILAVLAEELNLHTDDFYELSMPLEYYQLKPIAQLQKSELKYKPWVPVVPHDFADPEGNIFDTIRAKDVLVHHPYESFSQSVERFLRSAVEDKNVLAIKMTLYRTGEDSPFIPLLIRAAESGKQVVCLVELQARFDEERNILVAQALEKAGVHVVYGLMGLKTHSKIALVIRQDSDKVRSYVHIGTGNYNVKTALQYTDLGLFTARPDYTDDVVHLFHYLTGRSLKWNFKKLLIAPIDLRTSFLRMIEREKTLAEQKKPCGIIAKMNSLQDKEIIDALYVASQAGVPIQLIVRGVCCLRPQVPGISETISVHSIIGRYLEHSRVYYFRNGAAHPLEGEYFIGSADWMTRNLNDRVEAITPIEDASIKKRLGECLDIMLKDTRQGWQLQADGTYLRDKNDTSDGTQETLMKLVKKP